MCVCCTAMHWPPHPPPLFPKPPVVSTLLPPSPSPLGIRGMRRACVVAGDSPTRRQFGSFPSRGRIFCAGSRWASGLKGMRPHLLQLLLVQPLAVLDPLVVQVLVQPGHTLAVRVHPDGGSSPLPSPLSASRMLALSPTSVCAELRVCSPLRADTANGSRTRQKKDCRLQSDSEWLLVAKEW